MYSSLEKFDKIQFPVFGDTDFFYIYLGLATDQFMEVHNSYGGYSL